MIFSDLIDEFPPDMREPMHRLVDRLVDHLSNSPTRTDVQRLVSLVERQGESILALSEAQQRTEQMVEELAQAQKRTEQRVEELAEALDRTQQTVEKLAEAQQRTEQRVEELAEAQKKTDEAVRELAQAQRRTEDRMKDVQVHVGTISLGLGYRFEDEAIWVLPALLARDHGIEVLGELRRDFLSLPNKKPVEVNILGEGTRQGRGVMIMGEAKSQLKKRDIDQFLSFVESVKAAVHKEIAPLLITYQTSPLVKEYALEKGAIVYLSYQLRPPAYERGRS